MGLASLYQRRMLPFSSPEAFALNIEVHKYISHEAKNASRFLALKLGEPEWCKGTRKRNSHLCVTKDTELLTKSGYKKIIELLDKEVEIWNGHEWSSVKPFKTGENREIVKVSLSNGEFLKCTLDHRWLIKNDRGKKSIIKETKELVIGDKLEKWEYPIIDGEISFPHPYTSGFFTGDGSYSKSKHYENCKKRKEIRLVGNNEDKHQCLSKIDVKEGCSVRISKPEGKGNNRTLRFYIPDTVADKYVIPSINCKLEDKLNWLAGYFDSDGCSKGLVGSTNKTFIDELYLMVTSLGMTAKKSIDSRNGRNPLYSLSISLLDLQILNNYTIRVKFPVPNRKAISYVYVTNIEVVDNEDTYCLTEPKNSTALFNRIKTMQCATAPTRTNSVICNAVSQGIEPIDKNFFVAKQDKGAYIRKNPNLAKLLREKYNRDDDFTWDLISKNKGSVKDLDFLSDYEKEVFATAREIDQKDLVRQAADRQKYICQSQSLNLFVDPHANEQYLVELHLMAWKLGVKSLYYLRSRSKQTMDTLNYIITKNDCPWCVKLKEELDSRKVEYEEIPLSEAKRRGLWKTSYKTVPQLFYGNEHVGGYEDYMNKYVYGNAGIPMTNTIDGENPSECISCEG